MRRTWCANGMPKHSSKHSFSVVEDYSRHFSAAPSVLTRYVTKHTLTALTQARENLNRTITEREKEVEEAMTGVLKDKDKTLIQMDKVKLEDHKEFMKEIDGILPYIRFKARSYQKKIDRMPQEVLPLNLSILKRKALR